MLDVQRRIHKRWHETSVASVNKITFACKNTVSLTQALICICRIVALSADVVPRGISHLIINQSVVSLSDWCESCDLC